VTALATPTLVPFTSAQHLVLENVSWAFYEQVLSEAGEDRLRVTFDRGRIEIMSPLPEHEWMKKPTARLIEFMCFERRISLVALGNTTFRDAAKQRGLEPDECYYVANAAAARKIRKRFDPKVHPPPDLAIEADVTSRSIPRQPIYAALGVPELWRLTEDAIECLHLSNRGQYVTADRSLSFPFLPPAEVWPWVLRMQSEDDVVVLREFQAWVRALK
jgi:Uma2 family endonuclease